MLFLPYQDRDMLAYSLSAGDVHIVTNKKGLGGLRVPGKTYGVLAVGRPILYIGEPCCEVADLVRDHRLGFVIQERDVQASSAPFASCGTIPLCRQEISAPGPGPVRGGLPGRDQHRSVGEDSHFHRGPQARDARGKAQVPARGRRYRMKKRSSCAMNE